LALSEEIGQIVDRQGVVVDQDAPLRRRRHDGGSAQMASSHYLQAPRPALDCA
jgi:hypothetical protein